MFRENRLLADDSHEISYLIFFQNLKMSKNLSSAAVVMGALRVKNLPFQDWVISELDQPSQNQQSEQLRYGSRSSS